MNATETVPRKEKRPGADEARADTPRVRRMLAALREAFRKERKGIQSGVRLIIMVYVLVAGGLMLLTDQFVTGLSRYMFGVEFWSNFKGIFFVSATALLLYALISRFGVRLNRISESLRTSETKYRLLIEHSPDAICITRDGRIEFLNPAAIDLFGARSELDLLGRPITLFFHPESFHLVEKRITALMEGNAVPLVTDKVMRLDGGEREVEAASVRFEDGHGPCIKMILRDISDRRRKDEEILRLNRIYAVLSQINQAVVRIPSREQLFAEACNILIEYGGFSVAWVGSFTPETREVKPVAWKGISLDGSQRMKISRVRSRSGGLIESAILNGTPCIANDYINDPRTSTWHRFAFSHGCRSALCLPIRCRSEICGILMVCAHEPNYFKRQEVKLLKEVAMDISFALDRLEEEALRRKMQEDLAKNEEHLRFLVTHLHAGIVVCNPECRIILANPEACRLLGFSQHELLGKTAADSGWPLTDENGTPLPPDLFPSSRVIATGQPIEGCILGVAHKGAERKTWIHANAFPERNPQGDLRQVIVTFVDITDHNEAMEAVRESEEKFRTLFTASLDAILLIEGDRYIDCNQAALGMFRYPDKETFCRNRLGEISAPYQPDGQLSTSAARKMIERGMQGSAGRYEWACKRRDGSEFLAEVSLTRLVLKERSVIQAVVRDISWRRQAEQQLRQLSRVVEQSPSSVVITDTAGNIEYVNPRFTEDTGYSAEEVLGKNPRFLKSGKNPSFDYKIVWDTILSGEEWRGEFHNKRKNGDLFWASASICPITNDAGEITQFLAIEEDISERKRTDAALIKSEEKFFKAFNTAPAVMGIFTLHEGRCVEVNDAFVEVVGYSREEALGRTLLELGLFEDPGDLRRLTKTLRRKRELRNEECAYRSKKGESLVGIISAELIDMDGTACVISTILDITERKQMEEKFLRVQRMESIGALAGGMAHDLNNILAPIMMSASMLGEGKVSADTRRQLISGIEEAAQRGANIVNQVLTFARGVKGEHTVLKTNDLAVQISKMVKEIFPKSIAYSLDLPDGLWNIMGDSTQLQQVFLNLCVNARDAMIHGGSLVLSVENCEVDDAFAHMVPAATPGCYIQFKVTDTGTGIPKAIIDRIFEPFFTTKEPGKGTGLGLSSVVGIVRSHGGFLKVESELGKGSTFRVFLPATTDAVPEAGKPDQPSVSRGRGETLLVVDDEPEILEIIGTVLRQNGWNVVTAADGVEGVAAFLTHSGQIQALVTDMVMPNMDGLGLIRSVRKLAPALPILVSTGYSNEESRGELSELRVNGFLKKPFSARQLVAHIVALLYEPAD